MQNIRIYALRYGIINSLIFLSYGIIYAMGSNEISIFESAIPFVISFCLSTLAWYYIESTKKIKFKVVIPLNIIISLITIYLTILTIILICNLAFQIFGCCKDSHGNPLIPLKDLLIASNSIFILNIFIVYGWVFISISVLFTIVFLFVRKIINK